MKSKSILLAVMVLAGCSANQRDDARSTVQARPESGSVPYALPPSAVGDPVVTRAVPTQQRAGQAIYRANPSARIASQLSPPIPMKPYRKRSRVMHVDQPDPMGTSRAGGPKDLQSSIEAASTATNIANTGGSLFIPADAHGAAGPSHLVAVVNVSLEIYSKAGTQLLSQSLAGFFAALSPANNTFDPKVLYDQYEDRFVVVTLERVDDGMVSASNSSRVLVAVSDTSDPTGGWTMAAFDSEENIGGVDHWFDYPGFAVDEEAIYITGNLFEFDATGGDPGGTRVFILEKDTSAGFYAGGALSVTRFDPVSSAVGSFPGTMQPSHMYGAGPVGVGVWLALASGLSAGPNEFLQLIRIDDPLGTPVFTLGFVGLGDVSDEEQAEIPDGPQAGLSTDTFAPATIESNDQRTLDAVWRDDSLWITTTVVPEFGTDAGEATALWVQVDTSNLAALALSDLGTISGEDIAPGAFTTYASIAVNADGGMMIGFSATATTINAGSYFAYRSPTDSAGTTRGANTLRAGTDFYRRTFGGPKNRWGDYSAAVVDPDDECFWIYNKYAIARGNQTDLDEDGQWGTAFGHFCNDAPVALDDPATVASGGTVTVLDSAMASLLANDSDPDATDTLTLNTTPLSGPDHASAFSLNSDGTFSYTNDGSANDSDAVVYELCDDGSPSKCDTATLTLAITGTPVNTPPDAVADMVMVDEGAAIDDFDVSANDSDPDGHNLIYQSLLVVDPVNASSFSLSGGGLLDYQHDGSETTGDTLTYRVCDDGPGPECADATVTIVVNPINDAPVVNDASGLTLKDTVGVFDVLTLSMANDNDSAIDPASVQVVADGMNGGAVANADGSVSYTPDPGFFGSDAFTFTVDDVEGATSNVATFSVRVNELPVAVDDGVVTMLNTSVDVDVPANDSDDSGLNLSTVTITNDATNGVTMVNMASGQVTYTPNTDFAGADSFTYTIDDTDGFTSNEATVMVRVNQIPVANDDSALTAPNTSVAIDVVANDTDDTGLAPATVVINTDAANGGTMVDMSGMVTYTPDTDFSGVDSFTYTIDDVDGATSNVAAVTITVNAAPMAADDAIRVIRGSTTSVLVGGGASVSANDTDTDPLTVTVTPVTPPAAGILTLQTDGTFSYEHDGSAGESDSFEYEVCDSQPLCDTATVTITVLGNEVYGDGFEAMPMMP